MTERRAPLPFKLTTARVILILLTLIGIAVAIRRFMYGMGAASNLSNAYPWGIWITLDLLTGVPFAAGAFTICAAVYILGKEDFHPLVKPTVLTGFLGYLAVPLALLVDVGRPERLWYMLIYWNPHSPLFEVGLCVMTYLTVLFMEFSPTLFEWLNWKKIEKFMKSISMFFIILGVVLSTLHQSSLGSLFVMMTDKVHPLWHSPIMPIMFFVSAVSCGLSMIVVESAISARSYKREMEVHLTARLTKAVPWFLGLYLALRFGWLAYAGRLGLAFQPGLMTTLFWTEIAVGWVIPLVLFSIPAVRNNKASQIFSAALVLIGLMMTRFDTGLITWTRPLRGSYFPSWMELAISFGVIAGMCLLYDFAARHMNVFEDEHAGHGEAAVQHAAAGD